MPLNDSFPSFPSIPSHPKAALTNLPKQPPPIINKAHLTVSDGLY